MKQILSILFVLIFSSGFGQEILLPLGHNPVLLKKSKEDKASSLRTAAAAGDTLEIPFFDDFAQDSYFADGRKWVDNTVFINRDLPYSPPTLGVATFDGLKANGQPYSYAQQSGSCDTLTSRPLKLGSLLPSDNVYVSFYYQLKGRGDVPEPSDSLLLEFKAAYDTVKPWRRVWFMNGITSSNADTVFKYVSVKIADTAYFKDGFQFRFRNYGGQYGNLDHWHIDYVMVDRKTNPMDSTLLDVAFVSPLKSMLLDYTAVPWSHYKLNQISTRANLYDRIRNLDDTTQSSSFNAEIYDQNWSLLHTVRANSSKIIGSLSTDTVTFDIPTFPFPVAGGGDFAQFILLGRLAGNNAAANDSVMYVQRFYDYYAYDDGTAEAGYGITSPGAQVAYKFNSIHPSGDVLKAVQIYFSYMYNDVRERNFKILIWNDAGGKPGAVVYSQSFFVQPEYDGMTDFHIYDISEGNVSVSGTFYIGFLQESSDMLNLGIDRNTNASTQMFYTTTGTWYQTQFQGAWMMRPMFGPRYPYGIEEDRPAAEEMNVYPNPASDRLFIERTSVAGAEYRIHDLSGRIIEQGVLSESNIDVSDLTEGMYLLKVGNSSFKKFIVAR